MTTGYTGTPLPEKLGVEPGQRMAILDAPRGWVGSVLELPVGVDIRDLRTPELDVVLLFVLGRAALMRRWKAVLRHLAADGALWVAWPKRASGVDTDLTEDVVRELALAHGLVDNKVAALDETWSGLRLVVRLENREYWGRR